MTADGKQTKSARELFLLRLAYKEGRLVEAASNRPIALDTDDVWVVFAGTLDVFAVDIEDGRPIGARRHVCRVAAGQAAFGLGPFLGTAGLLAVGLPGTRLARVPQSRFFALASDRALAGEVASTVDGWVASLGWGVTRGLPPKTCALLAAGAEATMSAETPVRAARGVVWADLADVGSARLVDDEIVVEGGGHFPLSDRTWLWSIDPAKVRGVATATILERPELLDGLRRFHETAVRWMELGARRSTEEDRERISHRSAWQRRVVSSSTRRLASVLAPALARRPVDHEPHGTAALAFRAVAEAEGISVTLAPGVPAGDDHRDQAMLAARAADVRMRQVLLRGQWWRRRAGPLLAFVEDGEQPLALLPRRSGLYDVYDPADGTTRRLRRRVARSVGPLAFQVYRPFPKGPLAGRDLLRFGLRGSGRDLARLVVFGLASGLLAMIAPLVARALFDWVITGSDHTVLAELTVILVLTAFAAAALQITWSVAVVRIASRMDLALQSAIWDRLLSLPVRFFRKYAAGDLAIRATAVLTIRQLLSETALNAVLAFLFCLPNLALLFYLDWDLAVVAVGFVVVALAAAGLTFWVQLGYQRRLYALLGSISGKLLQLVSSVGKLHTTATEGRALESWAEDFVRQKTLAFGARRAGIPLTVFQAVLPTIALTILFAIIAFYRLGDLTTGSFVAFLVAFTSVLAPALQMCASVGAALGAIPAYERLRPVLVETPESYGDRADPGELRGGIELVHVSFAYDPDGPLVLDDVSMKIEPGEQIAIVGPSGSGKSTLFQLLTGFEEPMSGSVYFDGKDLSGLDLRAVRRQMGVVLQRGQLMVGDIFHNIVGAAALSVNAAWEAARMAGIDDDIRGMPMQMHTFVCEGASTFSGGQRQRLLIARALATKPRIVLFDEATSALDNLTQAVVSRSIAELQATRIVIAHRLSTIVSVDRIYVLEAGRIVQSGTYAELSKEPGLFASLVKRQVL